MRYYFLAGAEIVPRNDLCDRKKKKCLSTIVFFVEIITGVVTYVITIHMNNRVVAEGEGNNKGDKGKGGKSDDG